MLNFQEFQEYVEMNLKEVLSEEYQDAVVSLNEVTKNNGTVLHAVTVRPEDSNIAPNIYLDGYFKKYEEGADIDIVMGEIGRVAMDNMRAPEEFASIGRDFQNFDFVKDKIIMVAVNAERNRDLLAGAPHQCREDLALIYKVMIGDNKDGIATITIKNEHMAMWGVTTETIHDLAMENTKEILPVTIQSMNEVMREMFAKDGMPDEIAEAMFADMPANQQMYVISNASKVNGAASMFYEDALSGLADRIGTDLFILPSSVHECIAVSTDMGTPESLAEMVQEVNGTQVNLEEQLSDHVYRFDAKAKTISLEDTTMEQLEAKVSENTQEYDASQSQSQTEGARPRHHR